MPTMTIDKTNPISYFSSEAKANAIAAANNRSDPDWIYVVVPCGRYWKIEVYEDYDLIGVL